jgi:fused signal recognition particle receptor
LAAEAEAVEKAAEEARLAAEAEAVKKAAEEARLAAEAEAEAAEAAARAAEEARLAAEAEAFHVEDSADASADNLSALPDEPTASSRTKKSALRESDSDFDVDFSEFGGSLKEAYNLEQLPADADLAALALSDGAAPASPAVEIISSIPMDAPAESIEDVVPESGVSNNVPAPAAADAADAVVADDDDDVYDVDF